MAELPRRTGFKSSPEDAALYREFHDTVVSALREGRTPDQIVEQLRIRNVPESTARRIVWAVGHEVQHSDSESTPEPRRMSGIVIVSAVFIIAMLGFTAWRVGREGGRQGLLVPAVLILAAITCVHIARFLRKIRRQKL
jgi:hypothetical protein